MPSDLKNQEWPGLSLAETALRLSELGNRVLPLAPGAKVPLKGTRGLHDARQVNEVEAQEIWGVEPPPNLGWALPDRIVALDFDDLGTVATLEAQGHKLPPTVSQETPRGLHCLFLDADQELRQATAVVPGLDYRVGPKSYLVSAPSVIQGKRYKWKTAPWESDFAVVPRWAIDLQRDPRDRYHSNGGVLRQAGESLDYVLAGLNVGERNDKVFRYVSRLRAKGLERRETEILLDHVVSLAQQLPGDHFGRQEAQEILENVWRRYSPGSHTSRVGSSLRAVPVSELLRLELPPRLELLGDFLLEKSLVLLHAKRGVGKTMCGLAIALAVATGQSFLRWTAMKPRRVVYVDGEMPASDLQARLRALAMGNPQDLLSNLVLLASDLQEQAIPSLNSREAQLMVEEHLGDAALVVIDSHSTLIGGEENDAAAFQNVMDWLLRLRRQGLAVILIHHSGKGGEQRGSSRREDPMDVSIDLRHPADYEPTEFGKFELHFRKTRGVINASPVLVDVKQAVDGRLYLDWRPLHDRQRLQAQALRAQGLTNADIARELGVNRSTVGRWSLGTS